MYSNCGPAKSPATKSTSLWAAQLGFKLSLLKVLTSLATLGSAQVVIRDSSNVVIDSDFTYEFVDETCGGDFATAKDMMPVTTTEYTDSAGDTVYLTHFGNYPVGTLTQCQESPSAFIASFVPTSDLVASNTAQVLWTNDWEQQATGLNFFTTAVSPQVLGVENTCQIGTTDTPVSITGIDVLTLSFGMNPDGGHVLLRRINNTPNSAQSGTPYAFSNSSGRCKLKVVISNPASSNVVYLGTQSMHNTQTGKQKYVGSLGLYYKIICVQILDFGSANVVIDGTAGQVATSIVPLTLAQACYEGLDWTITETTSAIPTMRSKNSNSDVLTLDSATNPTSVNIEIVPTTVSVGDEYTWEVVATSSTDSSISAMYQIKMTIIDPCTVASFVPGQIQPSVTPAFSSYEYSGEIAYYAEFATDLLSCIPTFSCTSTPALPGGGDLCGFTDGLGQVMSWTLEDPHTSIDHEYEWRFFDTSVAATMTDIPPSTYTITLMATIDAGGANSQVMSVPFDITFVNPCLSTSLTGLWGWSIPLGSTPVIYVIGDPSITTQVTMQDTVSGTHGDQDGFTFCGPRTYTFSGPAGSEASLGANDGILSISSSDTALIPTTVTYSVEISLTDYTSVLTEIQSIDVSYEKQCPDVILTVPQPTVSEIVYWTWDPLVTQSFAAWISSATIDKTASCGTMEATWVMDTDGDLIGETLDTDVFNWDWTTEDFDIETDDAIKVGTYTLLFRLNLQDHPLVISSPYTQALRVIVKDRCTTEGGLVFPTPSTYSTPQYYFAGTVETIDASLLVTNYPTECPNRAYVCQIFLPGGVSTMSCDQDDGNGTVSTFNSVTGISTFSSNNMYNTLYEPDKLYQIVITVYAGVVADNILATAYLALDLPCMVDLIQFDWTIPETTETEFVVRDYLASPVYASFVIAPFAAPPSYDDSACNLIAPINYYVRQETIDQNGVSLSILSTGPDTAANTMTSLGPKPIDTVDTMIYSIEFANLFVAAGIPSIERVVQFVDGHQYLELDSYTQMTPLPIDLLPKFAQITLTAPLFKETAANGGVTAIQLLDPSDPLREVTFQIPGLSLEESSQIVDFTVVDNTIAGQVIVEFLKTDKNLLDTFDVVFCYSYGDWANLASLCDETVLHPVTNALGLCFVEFDILLEPITVNSLESQTIVQTIGEDSFTIIDLATIATVFYETPDIECDEVIYKLADEAQASFVDVEPTGLITLKSISDSGLAGTHVVQVTAQQYPTIMDVLKLTVEINLPLSLFDGQIYADQFTSRMPVPTQNIAPAYMAHFGETALYAFYFADPGLFDTNNQPYVNNIAGLKIRLLDETAIPGVVTQSSVQYAKVGVGKITLVVDGETAKGLVTPTTTDSEDDQEALSLSGSVTIEVENLGQKGMTAYFEINFNFVEYGVEEEGNEPEVLQLTAEEIEAQRKANDLAGRIATWREANKKNEIAQRGLDMSEGIHPRPKISLLVSTGEVVISFNQEMRVIPWFLEVLQDGLIEIDGTIFPVLQLEVIPDQDQDPSHVLFKWQVSSMTKREIRFRLIFENAVHVSQRQGPDTLKVTFRDPYLFIGTNNLSINVPSETETRILSQDVESEDKFLILTKAIPPLIPQGGYEEQVQLVLTMTMNVSKGTMILNFVINLLFSGSLNLLWALIETQQMIVMLPLFEVKMPGNARDFFVQLMEIAAFDYYDTTDVVHEVFDAPPTEPIDEDFEALGFESEYLLVNIGSLVLPWLMQAVFLVILLLIVCCGCKSDLAYKLHRRIFRFIFWGANITLVNESYMVVIVCLLINVQNLDFSTKGLSAMSAICLAFLVLYTIIPALFLFRICRNHKENNGKLKLQEPKWRAMYGAFYLDLSLKSGRKIFLHPGFFLLRRFLIAVAVTFTGNYFFWQFLLFVSQIIVQVMIIGMGVFPAVASENRSRYFNELIMMLSAYPLLAYTPWVQNDQKRFYVGYISISAIVIHLLVNFGPIIIETIKNCTRKIRLWCARRDQKITRKARRDYMQLTLKERSKKRKADKKAYLAKLKAEAAKQSLQLATGTAIVLKKQALQASTIIEVSESREVESARESSGREQSKSINVEEIDNEVSGYQKEKKPIVNSAVKNIPTKGPNKAQTAGMTAGGLVLSSTPLDLTLNRIGQKGNYKVRPMAPQDFARQLYYDIETRSSRKPKLNLPLEEEKVIDEGLKIRADLRPENPQTGSKRKPYHQVKLDFPFKQV